DGGGGLGQYFAEQHAALVGAIRAVRPDREVGSRCERQGGHSAKFQRLATKAQRKLDREIGGDFSMAMPSAVESLVRGAITPVAVSQNAASEAKQLASQPTPETTVKTAGRSGFVVGLDLRKNL